MTSLLVPPYSRLYDEGLDATHRRCFRFIRLEYYSDLTRANADRMSAGMLIECYVSDGFLLTGLVPHLTGEMKKFLGPTWRIALRYKTWEDYYESLFDIVRLNPRRNNRSTCLERIATLQTYSALQVVESGEIHPSLLSVYGLRSEMKLQDIQYASLKAFVDSCVQRHAFAGYAESLLRKSTLQQSIS